MRFTITLTFNNPCRTFARKMPSIFLLVIFSLIATPLLSAVFTVTSTANSGAGTLRQAILDANASADASSEIRFQSGLGEIVINADLPAITKPLKIDGYYNASSSMGAISDRTGLPVKIRLDDPAGYLFTLGAGSSGSEISGIDFHIIGSTNTAVCIYKTPTATVNDIHIWGNSFNYDYSADTSYSGSRGAFISAFGVVANTTPLTSNGSGWYIGAKNAGFEYREGNLIANSLSSVNVAPVQLRDIGNFVIAGNYFGFQRNGTTPLYSSQQSEHITATNCNSILVGANNSTDITGKRNLFACGNGVRILFNNGSGTHTLPGTTSYYWSGNNSVKGNYFGANKNGVPIAAKSAIHIALQGSTNNMIGGPNDWERNIITGAATFGIRIYNSSVNSGSTITFTAANNNTIQNNYIGVGSDGTTAGPNAMGISLTSSNTGGANSNLIINNNITGNRIAYNTGAAINIQKSTTNGFVRYNTITQNAIYQNGGLGIALSSTGAVTQAGGVDGNDGALSTDRGVVQQHMDNPVINSITMNSATSATIAGYIGNIPAGSTTFAGATVELFMADITPSPDNGAVHYGDGQSMAHGEGATYLGTATADANGLFTATVTGAGFTANTLFTGTATLNGSTSEFGPSISNQIILPVTLLTFNALIVQKGILLQWTTASEQNNKGFEIERSLDGSNWKRIGFAASQAFNGNSNTRLDYSYTDDMPFSTQNYYRLKQVDFDGKYEYSRIRSVNFTNGGNVSIYPNPAIESITVTGLQGNENIQLRDVSGKLVYRLKAKNVTANIPLNNLAAGIYYINIVHRGGKVSMHTVVKK